MLRKAVASVVGIEEWDNMPGCLMPNHFLKFQDLEYSISVLLTSAEREIFFFFKCIFRKVCDLFLISKE